MHIHVDMHIFVDMHARSSQVSANSTVHCTSKGGGITVIGVVWCEAGEEVTSDMSGEVDELPSAVLLPERLV